MILVSLYGYSGVGKSTSVRLLRAKAEAEGLRVVVSKLAEPLYELQQHFYRKAGIPIELYDQDQVLLEMIATQLRRISRTSIVNHFMHRMNALQADFLINDDLRNSDVDYPAMRDIGFRFVRVTCDEAVRLSRLAVRHDLTLVANSDTHAEIDDIPYDFQIDNSVDMLEHLEEKVNTLFESLT